MKTFLSQRVDYEWMVCGRSSAVRLAVAHPTRTRHIVFTCILETFYKKNGKKYSRCVLVTLSVVSQKHATHVQDTAGAAPLPSLCVTILTPSTLSIILASP